ncbi:MAG: S8 family serine peptidase, partial [Bacteroidota bacterium]
GETSTGSLNDFDIYLTNQFGTKYFGFNRNNSGGDPLEVLPFTVPAGQTVTANFSVIRASGNTPAKFKFIVFRGELTFNEYTSGASTIVGQSNANGAITLGAVNFTNTPPFNPAPFNPPVQNFSSRGGTEVNGVVRNKPDLVAPNGGNTTVQLGAPNVDGDAFPNFFGTSAAAPHAAGVGALLKHGKMKFYNQELSPASIRSILQTTALDLATPGFDFATGSGYIQAYNALATFAAPTPNLDSIRTPITPGTAVTTVTIYGNFFTTQSQVVFNGDTLSTSFVNGTTLTASLPTFFGNYGLYVYTPPIVPNINDGGNSDTLFFFDPIKKAVVVTADNKTKKYGETVPSLTYQVTVDGTPLASSGYTLSQLGLANLTITTPATSMSNVGIYAIALNQGSFDPGFNTFFNYTLNNGLMTINRMPLVITPKDTTITYGDKFDGLDI